MVNTLRYSERRKIGSVPEERERERAPESNPEESERGPGLWTSVDGGFPLVGTKYSEP